MKTYNEIPIPDNMPLMYETGLADVSKARQFVFREMVKLARDTIRAYEGDLYHDAVWLHENLSGDRVGFYWSFNESGTTIGLARLGLRDHAFRFTVWCDGGTVRLDVAVVGS